MRLLLDEMYPPVIAEQLRNRGHDVDAVTERQELRTLPDQDIFAAAQRELRAVVTENIADFAKLADDHDRLGHLHRGLVMVDPGRYQRGDRRTIGRMVTALDRLLTEHREDAATSLRHWL